MKHQKIKLVLSLDRLNVEVSKKMKKKNFQQFLRFQDHFLSFLENRIFFKNQAFLHAAPMIFVILSSKATKKKKNLKFYPTAVYRWGHLITCPLQKCALWFFYLRFFDVILLKLIFYFFIFKDHNLF
jgi:hypothetical protein